MAGRARVRANGRGVLPVLRSAETPDVTARHEIIGEEWRRRASELAEWAMERLVNRKDVWGQYSLLSPQEARQLGRTYKAMTLPIPSMRGEDMVTLDKLTRHFASRRHHRPQLIGLHAASKEGTSRWLGIDIDNHDLGAVGAEDRARRNLAGALNWWREFERMGYDPLLFDSSGAGGYHLWVLFAEPAPTADVYAFAKSVASTWERNHLEEEPEIFPKKPKPGSLGAWFRLPGMHHTLPHYSRLWSGDEWLSDPWLDGDAAIDVMLRNLPGPAPPETRSDSADPLTTLEPKPARSAASRNPRVNRKRPRVCIDLIGVLAERTDERDTADLGDPIEGAVAFTRAMAEFADILILTAPPGADAPHPTAAPKAEIRKAESRVRDWLDTHGFAYADVAVIDPGPVACAFIDDRGLGCRPIQEGAQAFDQTLAAVRRLCGD